MGKIYESIDGRLRDFVLTQPVFFVATAPADGHVNVSPKGMRGSFAVLDERRVAYLDYTGSGIETIAHLRENGRITLMFCAFEGPPKIVRLHGRGEAVLPQDPRFPELFGTFDGMPSHALRSVILVAVDRVSDSCGYAVPFLDYVGERTLLTEANGRKSIDDLVEYRKAKNATSIDGLPALISGGVGPKGWGAGALTLGSDA
jgi:Pyridoxamine 5'-phosphate oxidase